MSTNHASRMIAVPLLIHRIALSSRCLSSEPAAEGMAIPMDDSSSSELQALLLVALKV